jgi:hypothetical protein
MLKHNRGTNISHQSSQAGNGLTPDIQQRQYDDVYGNLPAAITANTALTGTNAAAVTALAATVTALAARVTTLEAADNTSGKLIDWDEKYDAAFAMTSTAEQLILTSKTFSYTNEDVFFVMGSATFTTTTAGDYCSFILKRGTSYWKDFRVDEASTSTGGNIGGACSSIYEATSTGTVVFTFYANPRYSDGDAEDCFLSVLQFKKI